MNIDQNISMQLYRVIRMMKKNMSTGTLAQELSMAQVQVLQLISEHITTMRILAEEMHIQMPTLTALVDRLENDGYVKRHSDEFDRRIVHVSMTAKGKRIWKKSLTAKMKRMELVLQHMSKKDKIILYRILNTLDKKLTKNNN